MNINTDCKFPINRNSKATYNFIFLGKTLKLEFSITENNFPSCLYFLLLFFFRTLPTNREWILISIQFNDRLIDRDMKKWCKHLIAILHEWNQLDMLSPTNEIEINPITLISTKAHCCQWLRWTLSFYCFIICYGIPTHTYIQL